MSKKIFKIICIFAIGMAGGIFSIQILLPYFFKDTFLGFNSEYLAKLASGPIYLTEEKEITVEENTALQYSIEKIEKSIFGIKAQTKEKTIYGSGLILTTDGLAVTLAELVPKGANLVFYVEGSNPEYEVLKRDLNNNLALIKIGKQGLKPCGFADFNSLKIGERVFLLGKVFVLKEALSLVNEGIVKYSTPDYIRTNLFEKSTLAGSALFNIKGELLGLNTIDSEGKVTAIPITIIRSFAGF